MSQSGESKYGRGSDLRALNEHLKTLYFDVRAQLKTGEETNKLIQQIREFEQYAEALSELPAELNLEVSQQSTPTNIEGSGKSINGYTITARRSKNSSYDFLLLEAFRWRDSFGPIGQSSLLKLALAFDDFTKKPSLVAKLNRWKNDKGWLEWSHSEDIRVTERGLAERKRLFELVERDGDLGAVREAFQAAWAITVILG